MTAEYISVLDLSKKTIAVSKPRGRKLKERGCEHCPANKKEGINKVKGLKRIKGKKIFIWCQNPGKNENDEKLELVGRAGQMLWEELDTIGITRDMCDVQNVVRCWTPDVVDGQVVDRAPNKEELFCCSIFNEDAIALNNGRAKIHLVFGQIAAKQLLGREYRKDTPIFWSEKLKAKVAVLDHPAYFLRGAPRERLRLFRERLKIAVGSTSKTSGKFGFLDEQKYKYLTSYREIKSVIQRALRQRTNRVSVDIEDGIIDPDTGKAADEGVRVILNFAICWKPGEAYSIPIDHPDSFKKTRKFRRKVIRLIKKLMSSKRVQKTLHHGTHDTNRIQALWSVPTRGYEFDTNYSTYLKWPAQKKYGLAEHAKQRVTEFAQYKDIIKPYLHPERPNFATIPLEIISKYNCADADLGKRLELMTSKMAGPLLRTYVKAAYVIDDMQTRGPYLDSKYYDEAAIAVPKRLKTVTHILHKLAGTKKINFNAPAQCAKVIYDDLHLRPVSDEKPRSTNADDLKLLTMQKHGKFPKYLIEYRELAKMEGTYLQNYLKSAELHEGQIRTNWWLTGTITGRLRSGGQGDVAESGIVNMQNLHGDPMLKNLLVSDVRWRRVLEACQDGDNSSNFWKRFNKWWPRLRKLLLFSAFDYAQIEIRILARMSGDERLLAAVESGDIHGTVGEELTGIPREKIKTDEQTRVMIKGLHFGIVYGLTPGSLFLKLVAEGVRITRERVEELYDKYFRRFSRVKQLIEHLKEFAEKHGYVETLFGFRRPIYTHGDDSGRQSYWGNQSINSPIQGSAHTLLLIAMVLMHEEPEKYSALQKPVAEVHDAFYYFHRTDELEEVYAQGKHLLEVAVPKYSLDVFGIDLKVPLVAECKSGYRMGSLLEFKGQCDSQHFLTAWEYNNSLVETKIQKKWKLTV